MSISSNNNTPEEQEKNYGPWVGKPTGLILTGSARNDKLQGTSRNDVLDGGAGSDEIDAGSGNDLLIWRMSENVGSRDRYDGGSGVDTLRLEFTRAEWMRADVQADIARFLAFVGPTAGRKEGDERGEVKEASSEWFAFRALGLDVRKIELLEVRVDGVSLDPRDEAVVAVNDTATVNEDGSVGGNVLANDLVPDLVKSVELVSGTARGTLVFNNADGSYSYTPGAVFNSLAQGQTATERFSYRVTDADGDSSVGTVVITITGSNDGPVVTNAAPARVGAVTEDGVIAATGQLSATDVDNGATQTWSVRGAAVGTYGSMAVNSATGQWTYTLDNANQQSLAQGESHVESFTIRITDDQGAFVDQTVNVTVNGTNDGPVVTNAAPARAGSVTEDTALTATGQLSASDIDNGATQAWTVQGAAVGTYGGIAVNSATGQWTYTLDNAAHQNLAQGESHVESFTIRVTDDKGAFVDQTVNVTVNGTNDGPEFSMGSGKLIIPATPSYDQAPHAVLQAGGKILLAGHSFFPNAANFDANFSLVRLNANGSLDESFGAAGKVLLVDSRYGDFPAQVLSQPDGGILVIGYSSRSGDFPQTKLMRLHADGSVDQAFGNAGTLMISQRDSGLSQVTDAVLQDDGKIVLAGAGRGVTFLRLNADGTTDSSFGVGGAQHTLPVFSPAEAFQSAQSVILQPDGKILAAGVRGSGESKDYFVVRLNADGSFDTGFGTGGRQAVGVGPSSDSATSVLVQQDGRILVAGNSWAGAGQETSEFSVVRLLSNGALDQSFGIGGRQVLPSGTAFDELTDAALQADGKLVLAGYGLNGASRADYLVMRLNVDGSLDSGFGVGGQLVVPVGSYDDVAYSLLIQSDGKIVAVGQSITPASANDFSAIRLNSDGSLDTGFGAMVAGLSGTSADFVEGSAPVQLNGAVSVFDAELAAANNYAGASLSLEREGGRSAEDRFSGAGSLAELNEGAALVVGGTIIGTVTHNSGGSLTLTFNTYATQALVNQALQSIAYSNTSDAPPAQVTIGWTFSDEIPASHAARGTSTVLITGTNDVPVITNSSAALAGATAEDVTLTASGQLSATDPDNGATQTWSVRGAAVGTYGSMAVNSATGQWTYTLDNAAHQSLAQGESHVESFTIRITDDQGAFVDQTVNVTVNGTNDGPVITNTTDAQAGSVTEDSTLTATGQLSASDVDTGATQAWSVQGTAVGTYGSIAVNSATGQWTYTLDNANHQDLAQGESHIESFTVRVTDDKGGFADQTVNVTVNGTNDAPVISGTTTGAISEDTTSTITGQLNAADPDHGAQRFWSVEGGAPTQAADYHFRADSFTITRNGANLVVDTFSDGLPPPSSPNSTLYASLGGFTESAGKLQFDSGNAVPFVGVGTPDPIIGQNFVARTNIQPTDLTTGLKPNAAFTITGVYDLVVPDSPREFYGIRAQDRLIGGNGTPPDSLGDDTYDLMVAQNRFGQNVVTLRHIDFIADVTTTLQSIALNPVTGADQIALKFDHVANSANLTASFQYLSGGVATGSVVNFTQVAPAFGADAVDTQSWLRGGMIAYTPAFTDSNLGGSYGTLNIGQSGEWTYSLNNALLSTQSLAQGQTAVDHFTVSVRDEFGATDTQSVDITVTGTNDAPVMQTPSVSRALVEDASAPNLTAAGLAQFSDADLTDAHTASASLASSALSGGVALPQGLADLLQNAMSVQLVQDVEPGHGQFQWDFALANSAVQFLAAGQTLTLAYNVNATDSFGASTTQVVTVTITGTNDVPVITNENAALAGAVTEDTVLTATGQLSATDVDNGATQAWSVQGAAVGTYGSIAVNGATGQWTYTLDNANHQNLAQGESHIESFTVRVTDDKGAFVDQTVNVTVNGTNDGPVITNTAEALSGSVTEDVVLTATGQLSASDVDNGATQAWSVQGGSTSGYLYQFVPMIMLPPGEGGLTSGTVQNPRAFANGVGAFGTMDVDATGEWTYTLDNAAHQNLSAGESFVENFTIRVTDDKGAYVDQVVSVTVTGTNDAAVLSSATVNLTETDSAADISTSGTLSISDIDSPASFVAQAGTHGSYGTFAINSAGGWTYTADSAHNEFVAGTTYTDTFGVSSADGTTTSVTVRILGTEDNHAPVITGGDFDGSVTVVHETGGPATALAASYLSAGSSLTNGLGGSNGFGENFLSRNDDGSTGAIDIRSVFGANGLNFFGHNYTSIYLNNNGNITFNGPSSTFTPSSISAGVGGPIIAPFWGDVDTRGTTSVSPGGHSTGSNLLWYDLDATNGVFTATWDDVGYYSFGASPNAFQVQLVSQGNGNFDIVFRYEAINWTAGSASGGSGGLGGIAARAGYNAQDGAHYFELPQSGNQAGMLGLPGTAGNTGIAGVETFSVRQGAIVSSALTDSGTIQFSDIDLADVHLVSSVATPVGSTLGTLAVQIIHDTTGVGTGGSVGWSYSVPNALVQGLAPGETRVERFSVTLNDQHGGVVTREIDVTIGGPNRAPVANADAFSVQEDAVLEGSLLTNDTDPDGNALSVTNVGTITTAHGTVILNANGTFSYTPSPNYNGSDAFSYVISDGRGGAAEASVSITVTPVNDPPGEMSFVGMQDGVEDLPYFVSASTLLQEIVDPDGDTLVVAGLQADHGTVVEVPSGDYVVTPDANYNGVMHLTYRVEDGQGAIIGPMRMYQVAAVNDAPVLTLVNDPGGRFDNTAAPYVEGGTPVALNPLATAFDVELAAQGGSRGAVLALARLNGATPEDVFGATGPLGPLVEGGPVSVNGLNVGSVLRNSGGRLELQLGIPIAGTLVNQVLGSITYANTSDAPPSQVGIGWQFRDGNAGEQGSGGELVANGMTIVPITSVDDAPVVTSATTATFAENGTGVAYEVAATDADSFSLTYSLGGADAAAFNINATTGAVTFKTAPNFEIPTDVGGNNVYDITVSASDGINTSAAQAVAISVTDVVESLAGQSVIDLGGYGKLIAPVQVDGGNWYYYWDRSGNGTSADTGTLNGGVDYTTHDVLDGIFNKDINGVVGGGGNTTDTYRYATLNGIRVALPTAGSPYGNGYQPGTTVGSVQAASGSNVVNATYNDLLAIWDAYNGVGNLAISISGNPAGWQQGIGYWSSTVTSAGHGVVNLDQGGFGNGSDSFDRYVALRVMFDDVAAPQINSTSSVTVAENTVGTVYTATATDADTASSALRYTLGGSDAALFNINATTGAVTFKNAPNYEAPADAGGNNVYDITVSASDGINTSAAKAVAISVTDVVESLAGQSVIDLGSYGKLIAPVQVDGGQWFYYWDRSGDGTNANTGTLNGGVDYTTHDVLDGIFNQNIGGVAGGGGNTTDTYRYATLNGVHLALPTVGGVTSPPFGAGGSNNYEPGTAVGSSPASTGSNAVNATYNDLLAVWDAYNGTGVGATAIGGTPSGWQALGYWSATPSASGHARVSLTSGIVTDLTGLYGYVALQVL